MSTVRSIRHISYEEYKKRYPCTHRKQIGLLRNCYKCEANHDQSERWKATKRKTLKPVIDHVEAEVKRRHNMTRRGPTRLYGSVEESIYYVAEMLADLAIGKELEE